MTLQMILWLIPFLLSVAVTAWAALPPLDESRDTFSFHNILTTAFRFSVALVCILFFWLCYFALMYWLS
jgi:hypothetical protein